MAGAGLIRHGPSGSDRPSKQARLSGDSAELGHAGSAVAAKEDIPGMSPALRALMGGDAEKALLSGGPKRASPAKSGMAPKVLPPRIPSSATSSSAGSGSRPQDTSSERGIPVAAQAADDSAKPEEEDNALSKFRSAAQASMSNLLNQLGVPGEVDLVHQQQQQQHQQQHTGLGGNQHHDADTGVNFDTFQVDVGAMRKAAAAGAKAAARVFAKQAAIPKVIAPKAGCGGSASAAATAAVADAATGSASGDGRLAINEQMAAVLAAAGAAGFTEGGWQAAMAQQSGVEEGPHVVNSGAELTLLVQVAQIAEEMAQSCLSASTFCATASYGGADQAQVMAVANYATMAAQRASWALEAATNFELAPQLKTEDVENWVSTVRDMIRQAAMLAEQSAQDCQERAEKTPTLSKGSLKDPRTRIPCKFFADGYCMNGSGCEFSHEKDDFKAKPLVLKYDDRVCSFHEQGKCARGTTCPWPHGLEELKKVRELKGVYKRKPGQMHMP